MAIAKATIEVEDVADHSRCMVAPRSGNLASQKTPAGIWDADWETLDQFAPSLPAWISKSRHLAAAVSKLGPFVGDFEILNLLGEGAFGKVFRARQVSLDRQVALKVTTNWGHEGRTMARLEHSHIVQVFSEAVDTQNDLRLLCMQYVPGATLREVLQELRVLDHRQRSGQAILDILDRLSHEPAKFDPVSLRDRQILAHCPPDEAVCWIAQQLAEAMAYAHSQGVLHRDIKPANIILNQYGQPMVTDFNLSFQATGTANLGAAVIGGTLGYMAPEQVAAFDSEQPAKSDIVATGESTDATAGLSSTALHRTLGKPATPPTTRDIVDERSDIYSLGAVLLEMFTCDPPPIPSVDASAKCDGGIPKAESHLHGLTNSPRGATAPPALVRILSRCLQPDPDRRYQSAGEVSQALAGCREWLHVQRELSRGGALTRWAAAHPLLFILLFTFVPNIVASAMNTTYIAWFVIQDLTPVQQSAFGWMVFWYNVAILVTMLLMIDRTLLAAFRQCRVVDSLDLLGSRDATQVRRLTRMLPAWGVILSCIGWLPFAPTIPLGMEFIAGPIDRGVLWNISVLFLLTGMIALVCNYYVISFVVLRVMYTRLWGEVDRFRQTAHDELNGVPRRNRFFQILAGFTPLGAAALMVFVGPEQFTAASFDRFRGLLTILIGAGIAGFWLATTATNALNHSVAVLSGQEKRIE